MKRLFVVLVVLVLAIGGGVRCAPSAENARSVGRPASGAQTAPGKRITALGTVEPEEVVDVFAQAAGRIVSLGADPGGGGKPIDYGSSVEAGTVLARIDSELLAARVEQKRACCARAEAELAQAKIKLERAEAERQHAQERKKDKPVPDSAFDPAGFSSKAAKASVAVAEAALAENKAALKQAEIELGYTTIKSPIKGVVIDRRVNVGQMAAPANAPGLFMVAKVEKLQVWASVNEADITQIHQGQRVRVTVDALPGKVFEGKVKQIRLNATMTQNVVTYTVVVDISSPTEKLLPYLTAHLEFE